MVDFIINLTSDYPVGEANGGQAQVNGCTLFTFLVCYCASGQLARQIVVVHQFDEVTCLRVGPPDITASPDFVVEIVAVIMGGSFDHRDPASIPGHVKQNQTPHIHVCVPTTPDTLSHDDSSSILHPSLKGSHSHQRCIRTRSEEPLQAVADLSLKSR